MPHRGPYGGALTGPPSPPEMIRRRGLRDDADFARLVGDAGAVLVNRQVVLDEHQSLPPAAGAGSEEAHRAEPGVRTFEGNRVGFHFAPPYRGNCKCNAESVVGPVRTRTLPLNRDSSGRFQTSVFHSKEETRELPLLFPWMVDGLRPSRHRSSERIRSVRAGYSPGSDPPRFQLNDR